jgi:hypothetical protein
MHLQKKNTYVGAFFIAKKCNKVHYYTKLLRSNNVYFRYAHQNKLQDNGIIWHICRSLHTFKLQFFKCPHKLGGILCHAGVRHEYYSLPNNLHSSGAHTV